MSHIASYRNHHREPEKLPSIHDLIDGNTSPLHRHYRQSNEIHTFSPYDYLDNTLPPMETVNGRFDELRLLSPNHTQTLHPEHDLDYDWVNVRSMHHEDDFSPTEDEEEEEEVTPTTRSSRPSKRRYDQDEPELDGQSPKKGGKKKKMVERDRRAREAAYIRQLEVFANMKGQKTLKELSPSNKKASGLNWSKEDTLRVTCQVLMRNEKEQEKAEEQLRILAQELNESRKECDMLKQKLTATHH